MAATDGKKLVVAKVTDPGRIGTIRAADITEMGGGPLGPMAFWPGADRLAFFPSALGGHPVIYDVHRPTEPRRLNQASYRMDLHSPAALAVTGTGDALAAAGIRGIYLYDVSDPANPVRKAAVPLIDQGARSLAFSPDGRTLAVGTVNDSSVILWDISDLASPKRVDVPLTDHAKVVTAIACSPEAATLASADADGVVVLWDVTDPHHPLRLGEPLKLHGGGVNALTFSKDSSLLFTGGSHPAVRIVDMKGLKDLRANAVDIACSRAGGGLTEDQWADFLPGLPFQTPVRSDVVTGLGDISRTISMDGLSAAD